MKLLHELLAENIIEDEPPLALLEAVWQRVVPPEFDEYTKVLKYRSSQGVLWVGVVYSEVKYELHLSKESLKKAMNNILQKDEILDIKFDMLENLSC